MKNIIENSTVEINDSINYNRRVFGTRGQVATEWYPNFPKAKVIKIETIEPDQRTTGKFTFGSHVCADIKCCSKEAVKNNLVS